MLPPPVLPYALNALEPHIGAQQLDLHFNQHHMTYYKNFVQLTVEQPLCVEEVICNPSCDAQVYNNGAQLYNHAFFWRCMQRRLTLDLNFPFGDIAQLLDRDFGGFEQFKQLFTEKAVKHFGSGWIWLLQDVVTGKLEMRESHDAQTPVECGKLKPILTLDVWEHAYYVDRQNRRAEYVNAWWSVVNWEWANFCLENEMFRYEEFQRDVPVVSKKY